LNVILVLLDSIVPLLDYQPLLELVQVDTIVHQRQLQLLQLEVQMQTNALLDFTVLQVQLTKFLVILVLTVLLLG